MKKTLHVKVNELLAETLNTRAAAAALFEIVKQHQSDCVEFDFDGVVFMSRSFADQFHKERLEMKVTNNLEIQISNADVSLRKILITVEETQSKKNRFYAELPVFNFTNEEKLVDYLWSL